MPRGARIRLVLVLQVAAIAAVSAALLVVAGLPLLARGALGPRAYLALVAADAAVVLGAGAALLFRAVARPLDRLLAAADRLSSPSHPGALPILADGSGTAISAAAVAFERVAGALADERVRLATKVEELTAANRALADARDSLATSERLATVGRLAAGLAHEVGNPLGAISGFVDLARGRTRDGGRTAEVEEFLDRIDSEAKRIDRTVRDLLDFARPSRPVLSAVDLGAVVEATVRLARVQARFRGLEVLVALEPGVPPVLADEHMLAQVFLNLLLNAGDALCGRGGVAVRGRREGDRVVVVVEDDGPGIPEADLERIFDPFFTTKEPGAGTGLGLAICHRIVESFGGEISATNRPASGAVFTLALRAAGAESIRAGAE